VDTERKNLSISCPTITDRKTLKKELKKIAADKDVTIFEALNIIVDFFNENEKSVKVFDDLIRE